MHQEEIYGKDYFTQESDYAAQGGYWTEPQPWHLERIERIIGTGAQTILDVGCANGLVVKLLRERGLDAIGVDISEYILEQRVTPYVVWAEAVELPFVDKQFDLVTSADLLEHIHEAEVPLVIAELERVGFRQLHDVTTVPGSDPTHITVKPLEWWQERFPEAYLKENT